MESGGIMLTILFILCALLGSAIILLQQKDKVQFKFITIFSEMVSSIFVGSTAAIIYGMIPYTAFSLGTTMVIVFLIGWKGGSIIDRILGNK